MQERETTICDDTVDHNTVTDNTVDKSTIYGSNEVAVFDNTGKENILKDLSTASDGESTEIMEKIWQFCAQ